MKLQRSCALHGHVCKLAGRGQRTAEVVVPSLFSTPRSPFVFQNMQFPIHNCHFRGQVPRWYNLTQLASQDACLQAMPMLLELKLSGTDYEQLANDKEARRTNIA